MSYIQTLRRIILPQAVKIAIPPLFNSFIALVKDTSLASTITVTEMFLVNAAELLQASDGAIVGSSFKAEGKIDNIVDFQRTRDFMKEVEKIRQEG